MTTSAIRNFRLAATDMVAVALILAVPTLSHLTAVPFYLLDPMRIAVLGALLCTGNRRNSMILAVALPLVSALAGGHPVFPKCLLMAAELAANVALLAWMMRRMNAGIAAFVSIALSKVLYYALKAAVLSAGLMQMSLVSTGLLWQLGVAIALSAAFSLVFRRK